MDNEKLNGIPEEETEAEVNETEEAVQIPEKEEDTEPAEACEEVSEEAGEESPEQEENEEESVEDVNSESEENADEAPAEEIDEDDLCACCGENRKEEGSEYCSECEAIMLSRKTPFLGWLGGLAAIIFSVLAFTLAVVVAAPSIQVARGDSLAKDNCWYSAYQEYTGVSSVVDELNSILGGESPFVQTGTGLNIKIIDAVAHSYSPLDAISVADSLLGENSTSNYASLKDYERIRNDYVTVYEALMAPIEAMSYGEADAATTYNAFDAARETEGVNGIYIDYFLYNAAVFYNDENSVKLKYLEAVDKAAKESGEDYSWLYYQDYASVLSDAGENEKAMEYLNALTEGDRTKFGAYELKMRLAIADGDMDEANRILAEFKNYNEGYDTAYVLEASLLRVSGKLEEAKVLLTEALEQYDSVPELHRQRALVYLLEGDYDNAYESAYKADNNAYYLYAYMGDSSAYTPQLTNTLYLCTYLAKEKGTGATENAAWIDDILSSFTESEISEQVNSIINGEKTVEEVLTEGACDLA